MSLYMYVVPASEQYFAYVSYICNLVINIDYDMGITDET